LESNRLTIGGIKIRLASTLNAASTTQTLVVALCATISAGKSPAQACPAFDSTVSLQATGTKRFHSRYDHLSDSTYYFVDLKIANAPMLHVNTPDLELQFIAAHEGEKPNPASNFGLQVSAMTMRRNIADRVEDRSYLADIDNAIVLIDDSVRLHLAKADYSSRIKDDPLLGRRLEEKLAFKMTADDWRRLARGSRLVVRIGSRDITMGGSQPEGARNILHTILCSSGQ